MKRAISIMLSVFILIIPAFETAFADGESADVVIEAAEKSLFGMYTKQSGDALRDCYHKAITDSSEFNINTLSNAISNLVPLNSYTHIPFAGFIEITDEDIARMKLNSGSVSQSDGVISIQGDSTLRYCNAGPDGIIGTSPFGIPTDTFDGIAIKIQSSSESVLDFSIGKRGTDEDCTFNLFDIKIAEGNSYYFFPFDAFGTNIPSDGTLNYISLSFTGTSSVSFEDLHAVVNSCETAVHDNYEIEQLTGSQFDPEEYYRIYQHDTKLALSLYTNDFRSQKEVFFAEEDLNDRAQEWQIVSVASLRNKRLIVNRKYGIALYITTSPLDIDANPANLNNLNYGWNISYKKGKGFSIEVSSVGKLAFSQTKAKIYSPSTTAKYYDIYRVPGEKWNLSWSDEFNQEQLDRSVWTVMNAKNRGEYEPMYNRDSPENVYMEDGNLVIRSKVEEYRGYHATSAYLDTQAKVLLSYGRVEMRAKMPEGEKIWPALWMMGDIESWPRCGEIDIVEMVGGDSKNYRGDGGVIGTLHYPNGDGTKAQQGGTENGTLYNSTKLSEDYHLYAFEWDSEYMRWYFDNILYYAEPIDNDQEKYTFVNNPMYLILDTSIEGPGANQLPVGLPDESKFYIDYIRYFKEEGSAVPESKTYSEPIANNLFFTPYGLTRGASFSRNNDIFALPSYSNKCPVYDMKTGYLKKTIASPYKGWMLGSALSPDGKDILIVQENGQLVLMNIQTSAVKWYQTHPFRTAIAEFSADGKDLIVGTRPDGTKDVAYSKQIHIYSADSGEDKLFIDIPSATSLIKVSEKGNFAIGLCDGTIRLYDFAYNLLKEYKADDMITCGAFSSDGNKFYAGTASGKTVILDTSNDTRIISPITVDEIYGLDISPDGKELAVAYGDGNIRLFDESNGKLLNRISLDYSTLRSVSYSPDGNMLLVACSDGYVKLISSDCSKVLAVFNNPNHPHAIYTCATLNSDCTKIFAAGNTLNFYCAGTAWNVPEGLITEEIIPDYESIINANTYVDELKYTAESFGNYLSALKNAVNILQNKYASQESVNDAANNLSKAIASLHEKPDIMKGDFDGDEQITVADALAALRIAAKLVAEDSEAIAIGDIDNDQHVTVADALAILRVAAKLTDTL